MLVGVGVAVEGLVLFGHEEGIDADELADGRVVFAGSYVGESGVGVLALAEEALVIRPGAVESARRVLQAAENEAAEREGA
ncbi:hypothetical protein ACFWM0_29725 [Streptomyces sp. NPDC058405]|uniref:hypothetical protein n=1 Tax=Streptomyces sp. NPDC058405 TaxID=3346482 RepID=UPI0036668888